VTGEGTRGSLFSMEVASYIVHSSSENSTCETPHIRSCPRKFTRPHLCVPPYYVHFLFPMLLPTPNTTLQYRDYCTIKREISLGIFLERTAVGECGGSEGRRRGGCHKLRLMRGERAILADQKGRNEQRNLISLL